MAVKILPAEFSTDPIRKQRFEREAKVISGLNHPNVCTLHDVGTRTVSSIWLWSWWRVSTQDYGRRGKILRQVSLEMWSASGSCDHSYTIRS